MGMGTGRALGASTWAALLLWQGDVIGADPAPGLLQVFFSCLCSSVPTTGALLLTRGFWKRLHIQGRW